MLVFKILGTLSPEVLRSTLATAMRGGDKDILGHVISECVAAGMPELDSIIEEARGTLMAREYAAAKKGVFLAHN